MNSLMCLVKRAQQKDSSAVEAIISKFKPKIQKSLMQTSYQERSDLSQEVSLKIIEAIYKYDLETIPGFWDFIENEAQFLCRTNSRTSAYINLHNMKG